MATQNQDQKSKNLIEKIDGGMDTGTTNMLIGGGIGAYGATTLLAAGFICPTCIIAAPLFLGIGAAQRHAFLKKKVDDHTNTKESNIDE